MTTDVQNDVVLLFCRHFSELMLLQNVVVCQCGCCCCCCCCCRKSAIVKYHIICCRCCKQRKQAWHSCINFINAQTCLSFSSCVIFYSMTNMLRSFIVLLSLIVFIRTLNCSFDFKPMDMTKRGTQYFSPTKAAIRVWKNSMQNCYF